MKAGASVRARRPGVPRDTYRGAARSVGIAPRIRRRTVALDVAILALAGAFLIFSGPIVGTAVSENVRQITATLSESFAASLGSAQIELPSSGTGTVGGSEPVASGLPDFTQERELQLAGRVPSFAVAPGRSVEVVLNAAVAANAQLDETGAFSTKLTLQDGANAIGLTLLAGTEIIARSAYTVVVDRQPPTLDLLGPVSGSTVDGPNVVVQGKAEVGATVTVNDRTIVPGPDGSFSESFTPSVGPVEITVVARDRAGNETTAKSNIVVRAPTAAATVVSVTLERTRVRPGETVVAQIRVTENGVARPGTRVTLSVGLITIASFFTDGAGNARFGFAAPPNEGDAAVIVFAAGATGRASLTVAR